MTDLTEDVMLSLLQDSYKKTRKFEKLDFDVVGMEQQDGKINLYFNLDTTYREYIEGENPAVPLMLGEEQHFEIPMRSLLYTSPSPRDHRGSRMPSSA